MRFSRRSSAVCVLLALLWPVLALPCVAQGLPASTPESVGLSSERLERIARVVQRHIDENRIAGAVMLVGRRGRVAWLKAPGMMDKEAGKSMTPDALFRICSMTKPITSTAVMMLYEEGLFQLSDPVSRFIPEFKNPKVLVKQSSGPAYTIPSSREIAIRHLLTHTSGLTYHWNPDLGPRYRDANVAHGLLQYDGKIADSIKALAGLPLLFHPGERYEYSLAIDVLGYLVEVVSGMSLEEFFQKRIFEPLGMKDTHFYVPADKASRLATAYTWYAGKGLNRFPEQPIVEGSFSYSADYATQGPRKLFAGGAGLSSTAMDYARLCQMMLDGGKAGTACLLSRKSVELMTHDQLGRVAPGVGFGLGFGVVGEKGVLQELGSPGRYGWGGFFYTHFFIDPKENMFGVFMAQLHPTGGLNLNLIFETLAYQSIID